MALDPKYFAQWEPLPPNGTLVTCHYRNGTEITGTLQGIWLCEDTPAFTVLPIGVININGTPNTPITFLPEFEDGWTEHNVTTRRRIAPEKQVSAPEADPDPNRQGRQDNRQGRRGNDAHRL